LKIAEGVLKYKWRKIKMEMSCEVFDARIADE
jgi:hypothetical protein